MAAPSDPLADFQDRRAGSIGERRALEALQQRLAQLGCPVHREGFVTATTRAGVVFGHLVLAFLPALTSWWWPGASMLVLMVMVACMWAEWTGRAVLREHLPRGRSYNLVVPMPHDQPATSRLVLVAYVDQPEGAIGFSRRLLAAGATCTALLAVNAVLRSIVDLDLLDYVHLVAGGLLGLVSAVAFLLWRSVRGSGPSVGVARLLQVAGDPPSIENTELVLAFCGAGHAYESGLRALKRQHRHEWGPETRFVPIGDPSLDEVLG